MRRYRSPEKRDGEYDETAEVYPLGYFNVSADSSLVTYDCGHKDYPAVYIRIPERLKPLCRSRNELRDINSHKDVVAIHHDRAAYLKILKIGLLSASCADCLVTRLKADLAALDARTPKNDTPHLRVVPKRKK